MSDVLLLNQDHQPLTLAPLSVLTWQQAVKAYFLEKVVILRSYPDWECRSPRFSMPMPSIVVMGRYVRRTNRVHFTRRNIYLRDRFLCQYCGKNCSHEQLTIDHVVPKSRGGATSWDNVVAACYPCNTDKGADAIEPLNSPAEPSYWQMVRIAKSMPLRIPDLQWQDYLQWPPPLVQVNRKPQAQAA
jgi:5-methylcytosine-specific restriction endonuclease McrA